jgi:hypothetical protein
VTASTVSSSSSRVRVAGLEGHRGGYGESVALQNRLRRMWAGYEDTLADAVGSSPPADARDPIDPADAPSWCWSPAELVDIA